MGLPTGGQRPLRRAGVVRTGAVLAGALVAASCASMARVSLPDGPRATDGPSRNVAVDPDTWPPQVAFESDASQLVPGDTNGTTDVFLRSEIGQGTELMSQASDGTRADGPSRDPAVTARHVAFESDATNLAGADANGLTDIYVRTAGSSPGFLFTDRISRDAGGGDPDGASRDPAFGRNGRRVAFTSDATDLLPDDAGSGGTDGNGVADIYVRDRDVNGNGLFRETGDQATARISVAAGGGDADGASAHPSLSYYFDPSPGGDLVAFDSEATNLVAGDTNGVADVFVRDRTAGTTIRISVRNGAVGAQANGASGAPSLSADGLVAFESSASNLVAGDTNGVADVFVRDPAAGTTRVYSSGPGGAPGDAASHAPAFGAFGGFAYVAFGSSATNLGEDPHFGEGVFWRLNPTVGVAALDRPAENGDPQIEVLDVDDDGSHVLFASDSRSVVTRDALGRSVYLRDVAAGRTTRVSLDAAGQAVDTFAGDGRSGGAIDGDASVVAFSTRARLSPGDTDDDPDVYVHDLTGSGASGGAPALVSTAPAGVDLTGDSCGSPSLSRNGQKVAFTCTLPGPIQNPDGFTTVLVHDRATATTSAVNRLTALPEPVHVSGDGRYVTFTSTSGEVPGDTNGAADVFVRDLAARTTVRVSVTGAGAQANGDSDLPDISADGRYVVFQTVATNLVAGDTFGTMDVFVHDRDSDADGIYDEPGARTTTLADVATTGSRAGESYEPAISDDGHIVAFSSDAGGVVPNDTNGNRDVFVRNMTAGTTTRVSTSAAGAQTPDHSSAPRLSADGEKVAFRSGGPNLVDDDRNGLPDVFVTSASR